MEGISKRIVDALTARKIVLEEDQALYIYGVHQGLVLSGNMLTTLLIGWIYGMIVESLVFLSVYICLRSNAGGYHAKTPTRCYILSTGIVVAALSGIRYIPWSEYMDCGSYSIHFLCHHCSACTNGGCQQAFRRAGEVGLQKENASVSRIPYRGRSIVWGDLSCNFNQCDCCGFVCGSDVGCWIIKIFINK